MANLPISGFPTGGTIAQAGDEFVIARSGANYKLTSSSISAFVLGGPTTQLGAADVASGAVAQTLQVQSNTGAATTGPNFTIKGSSGTTAGGSIIFQTHNGTAYGNALTLASNGSVTMGSGLISYLSINPTGYTNGIILSNIGSNMDIALVSGASIHWSENTTNAGSGTAANGVWLWRDAANTLALRNGPNAQTFNVYETYTDATTYRRAYINAASGTATFGWEGLGSGNTTGNTIISSGSGSGSQIYFRSANTLRWTIDGSGHFLAVTDNTYNIGASNANRPANIYIRGIFYSGPSGIALCDATNSPYGYLQSNASGVFRVTNAAGSDFSRLCFGDYTSSFPALKRSTTTLQVRLADDTGDAALQCGTATSGGTAFNVNGTGGNSIASITNTTTGTLLQVLNSTSNPLMTVTDTTSGTLFSVQSTTAATLFSVNDTTSGTLLAVTNSSATDVFTVSDAGVFGADGASANVLAIKNSTTEQRLRIYNTTASSGSYFFVGAGVNDDGTVSANTLNIGTGGAGAALSKFAVVVNGTTRLDYNASSGSNWTATGTMRAQAFEATNSDFKAPSGGYFYWASRAQMKSPADKVMVVEDSAAGPAIIQTKQFTVTNLPAPTSYAGAMAFVSDATATTPRSTVLGGGSNKVMVMSDGTNWLIVA